MLKQRIIPTLLIKNEALVKTKQFRNPQYIGDPINAIKIFNEKEVDELVVLDILASAKGKEPNFLFIRQLAGECFMPLAYGGGIRTLKHIEMLMNSGVEKMIINTMAFEKPEFISDASIEFGTSSIVVSIDIKKDWLGKKKVYFENATKKFNLSPIDAAKKMEDLGAGELILHSVDLEGTYKGYDLELIEKISSSVSIPTIACGGAASIKDIGKVLRETTVSAACAGSIFVFHGIHKAVLITYPDKQTIHQLLI